MSGAVGFRPEYTITRGQPVSNEELALRVMANISMTSSGCWQWSLVPAKNGYGMLQTNRNRHRAVLVHRFMYEYHKGTIPTGFQVDHLCRNRLCVNPDHLEAVTQQENIRRQNEARRARAR